MDTNIDLSERMKQFNIGRFNIDKLNEIDSAVNMFNFDMNADIYNDNVDINKNVKNKHQIHKNREDKIPNPMIRDLESTSKYNNKNDTEAINRNTLIKARALAKE